MNDDGVADKSNLLGEGHANLMRGTQRHLVPEAIQQEALDPGIPLPEGPVGDGVGQQAGRPAHAGGARA